MPRNGKPREREETAFLGVYAEPLISEARAELDRKTQGQWKGRTMLECRRGWLWMVRKILKGRQHE